MDNQQLSKESSTTIEMFIQSRVEIKRFRSGEYLSCLLNNMVKIWSGLH